ncbi:MAG TPA: hypothetical protein VME46_04295 [Acidimicrobiales bacterium]|nr:hypothetical protein [Acidimicrobiales bacterium]
MTHIKNRRKVFAAAAGATVLFMTLSAGAPAWAASGRAQTGSTAFWPRSVTFVSSGTGWALGAAPCAAKTCLALYKTSDGGHTWAAQALPTSLVKAAGYSASSNYVAGSGLNVRFANQQDGWIFGWVLTNTKFGPTQGPALWSTHDGGASWHAASVAGLSSPDAAILDLEASANRDYLLSDDGPTVTLRSGPVGRDAWSVVNGLHLGVPAGGANMTGAIVLQGDVGWLVAGNDRGTTGSARLVNGHWSDWAPPCASVGGTLATPAAASTTYLAAVCVMGGFASPLSKSAPAGATIGSSWLYVSSNGGASFQAVSELGKMGTTIGAVASPAPGDIFVVDSSQSSGASHLQASFNGGHSWASVYNGYFDYLGFTTTSQGVGIVGTLTADKTAMVMTRDGGHSWQAVTF